MRPRRGRGCGRVSAGLLWRTTERQQRTIRRPLVAAMVPGLGRRGRAFGGQPFGSGRTQAAEHWA